MDEAVGHPDDGSDGRKLTMDEMTEATPLSPPQMVEGDPRRLTSSMSTHGSSRTSTSGSWSRTSGGTGT